MIPYNTDAPLYHLPIATVALIVVNSLLFLAVPTSLIYPQAMLDVDEARQAIAAEAAPAAAPPAANRFPLLLEYGQGLKPWQWMTSIFLHADFFHLLFNMIALWSFGLVVEGKVGALVFLGLYVGIGVVQSGVEQTLMSFADPGGSLGASAAIFGILGLAIVWAPRNDFDVLWSFGLYVGTIEIPILVYGLLMFGLECLGIVLGHYGISSGILHLMGLALGVGLGFLWLRREWVDCEGWDLLSVLQGQEGQQDSQPEIDDEARHLVRASLKTRHRPEQAAERGSRHAAASSARQADAARTASKSRRRRPAGPSAAPVANVEDKAPTAAATDDLAQLITAGNMPVALKLLDKLRRSGTAPELPQPLLNQLIRGLLTAQAYEQAVPFLAEHIHRFPQGRQTYQLNLAKVLLHLERPNKARQVLQSISTAGLDEAARTSLNKLAAQAKRLIDAGIIELSE